MGSRQQWAWPGWAWPRWAAGKGEQLAEGPGLQWAWPGWAWPRWAAGKGEQLAEGPGPGEVVVVDGGVGEGLGQETYVREGHSQSLLQRYQVLRGGGGGGGG